MTQPEPQAATITYTNWKGETGLHRIMPERLYFGSTKHHPKPQRLLEAHDLDKNAMRTFALEGIMGWSI